MAHYNGMERLSAELLDAVVSNTSTRDRVSLSQASRYLHDKVTPSIYTHWSYCGWSDGLKSLYCFLRTIILHPWLARRVKTLDIRGWGDYARPPGVHRLKDSNPAEDEDEEEGYLYKDDFKILQRAIRDLELDGKTAAQYEQGVLDGNESVLLALIISRLPALQIMYMIVPKSWNPVRNVLLLGSRSTSNICRHLHKIYICHAWIIRARGGRECSLDLFNAILPLCNIPSLRSLQTLTSHTSPFSNLSSKFDDYTARSIDVTELALDESLIEPKDLLKFITLPKALETFRWGQSHDGFVSLECPPTTLHRAVVEGLKTQKDHLQSLDLNGIAPTPSLTAANAIINGHLIGSMKEFAVLRTLSIPAIAVCGDTTWGPAPHKMVDILPASLETLNLRIRVVQVGGEKTTDGVWMDRMVELVLEAKSKLPALRKVALVVTSDWRPTPEDKMLFERIEDACAISGIGFEVRKGTMFGLTPEPYFQGVRVMRS